MVRPGTAGRRLSPGLLSRRGATARDRLHLSDQPPLAGTRNPRRASPEVSRCEVNRRAVSPTLPFRCGLVNGPALHLKAMREGQVSAMREGQVSALEVRLQALAHPPHLVPDPAHEKARPRKGHERL